MAAHVRAVDSCPVGRKPACIGDREPEKPAPPLHHHVQYVDVEGVDPIQPRMGTLQNFGSSYIRYSTHIVSQGQDTRYWCCRRCGAAPGRSLYCDAPKSAVTSLYAPTQLLANVLSEHTGCGRLCAQIGRSQMSVEMHLCERIVELHLEVNDVFPITDEPNAGIRRDLPHSRGSVEAVVDRRIFSRRFSVRLGRRSAAGECAAASGGPSMAIEWPPKARPRAVWPVNGVAVVAQEAAVDQAGATVFYAVQYQGRRQRELLRQAKSPMFSTSGQLLSRPLILHCKARQIEDFMLPPRLVTARRPRDHPAVWLLRRRANLRLEGEGTFNPERALSNKQAKGAQASQASSTSCGFSAASGKE
ncbi:hypothetical protein C8Q79DRAFT_1028697 [Trametes meyenii]|nr:hypothetical protein C8Q79DRAFT_1028697 [Trametes meyenii]